MAQRWIGAVPTAIEDARRLRTIGDLAPGDHPCCVYETEAEHRAILTPYLRQGLEGGERVLYIVDAHTAGTVLGYLRDDGLDPDPLIARGQLVIQTGEETYLRDGTFAPEAMIALLRSETERAVADGFGALRVTGEMTWALRGLSSAEPLIRYEVLLNEFLPGSRCLAICQYDRRCFEPEVLLEVLRTHPHVVIGSEVCANPHYVPPADFLGPGRPAAELQAWIEDLTACREAEDAVRSSSAFLQSVIEGSTEAIYVKDLAGRYRLINAGAATMLGRPAPEVLGLDDADLLPPAEAAVVIEGDRTVMAAASPTTSEERVTLRGVARTFLSTKGPIRDEFGTLLGLFGIARDITEHKAADEALRQAQKLLNESQRLGRVGGWEFEIASGVQTWTDEVYRIHEIEPGGHPTVDQGISYYTPASRPVIERAVEAAIQHGQPFDVELEITTARGNVRGVRAIGVADPDGRRVYGFFQDITDRKAAEDEIRRLNRDLERRVTERTAKLQAAVDELEAFNYSASHDLRAPLRAINGYATLLERHQGGVLDETSRRYLGLIETASERLGTLLEELLDYSRLGRDGVRAVPVPLAPLVAGLRDVYGDRLAAAGGRLELAEPHAVPMADPHLLERILDNLVENALAYRRADVPPLVTVSAVSRDGTVTVSVADNGIGIPPGQLEQIFGLFTRLHREEEYPGTGVGLSIVRKAARLMGSDVTVESVEGQGSTFSLVLAAAADEDRVAGS